MKQQHDLLQGSPEWDAFRLTKRGASEAAAMLGLSRTMKRNELLRMKKTGIAREFSEWLRANVLDKGHEVEAMARPHAAELIGSALYPVTMSDDEISASCDGLTMEETTAWEHKQWNDAIAARVRTGSVPLEHMPQCQQILMVTGAEQLLFTVSDGTPERMLHCWVKPDPAWFDRLRAGWAQFDKDLAEYVPTEVVAEPIGRTPDTLPALRIEVTGAVTASNLAQYREHALAVFGGINRDLKTDQDFANADKTVKWCADVEDRLKAAKEHALSQTESIDALFKTIDDITAEARKTRLELSKLVTLRKVARKEEIVSAAAKTLTQHVVSLNERLGGAYMPRLDVDLLGATKNLRTFDSMQNAVDTALAAAKIDANAIADRIAINLRTLADHAEYEALFPDEALIVVKAKDDFDALVASRIGQHKESIAAAADKAAEQARERIREEERHKALQVAAPAPAAPLPAAVTDVMPAPVRAAMRAPANAPAADTPPTLSLGQIGTRLGFTLTADFIRSLGVEPAGRQRAAVLYHEHDFSRIGLRLIEHVKAALEEPATA